MRCEAAPFEVDICLLSFVSEQLEDSEAVRRQDSLSDFVSPF